MENYLDKNNKIYILPKKVSKRLLVLEFFIEKFKKDQFYTEREVNEILNEHHSFNNPCIIRRELFEKKFLGRKNDCSKYWRIK